MNQSVTLKDVALLAGVSPSTVSRVLNGHSNAGAETEKRILDAAARLHFQPNALARSLVTGRSQLVGVLADRGAGRWSMPVLVGAISAFAEQDIASLLRDAHADQSLRNSQVRALEARRVDGVLVVGAGQARPYASVTDRFTVPVVYAHDLSTDDRDTCVVPDDQLAGRLAGEHLIEIGRTRVALITTEMSVAAKDRTRGLVDALGSSGLRLSTGPLLGSWTAEWGRQAGQELVDHGVRFDAIVCGNDAIAYGVHQALTERGLRVPEDVALIGHDNWEAYFGQTRFLTTIDPRLAAIGSSAADRLLAAITERRAGVADTAEPRVVRIAGTLLTGVSTLGRAAPNLQHAPEPITSR